MTAAAVAPAIPQQTAANSSSWNSDRLTLFEQPQGILEVVKDFINNVRESRNANGGHRI
ncbi:MAG: hypothetical protein ACRD8A_03520 [Candidatus Acidiferrales bacterium]